MFGRGVFGRGMASGVVGDAGRRRIRARQCLAPTFTFACDRKTCGIAATGDDHGFAPHNATGAVGGAGRRRIRARQCLAPTFTFARDRKTCGIATTGDDHGFAPHNATGAVGGAGRRRIRARHGLGLVGDAGRRRIRARQCLAPTFTFARDRKTWGIAATGDDHGLAPHNATGTV